MKLTGLPEGVEAVGWADDTAADAFYMVGLRICTFRSKHMLPALQVTPAEGYEFVYDVPNDEWAAVEKLPHPRSVRVLFTFTNERQAELLPRLKNIPGFVEIEEL